MRWLATLAVALVACVGFTCSGPPVIANDLDQPIVVRSVWADGSLHEGELPASGRMFLSGAQNHPVEVTITVPGSAPLTFTAADAPDLLSGVVTGPTVGWRVTETGIVPLAEDELAQ